MKNTKIKSQQLNELEIHQIKNKQNSTDGFENFKWKEKYNTC